MNIPSEEAAVWDPKKCQHIEAKDPTMLPGSLKKEVLHPLEGLIPA